MAADPLAAVPRRPADVELRRDSRGLVHLRRRVPLGRAAAAVARWLRYDYSRTVALDAAGSAFYEAVDGATPLRQIAERLAAGSDRPHREVVDGVVLFVRQLMTRHLLELQVPAPGGRETP